MNDLNINKNRILKIWFLISGIIGLICFLLFVHYDILVTAQQACTYLDIHFRGFYRINKSITGSYSANYFPSTYILFAIWNIPLKILHLTPAYWGDWNIVFALWNKLLVFFVFMITNYVFYKICIDDLEFPIEKAKTTVLMFATMPVVFFSEFIFGQYDIFTVLFIMLGYHYWLKSIDDKKNRFKFILFFGIAASFKLFALIVFFILLLLQYKKVGKIIIYGMLAILPMALESLPYLMFSFSREIFIKQVFGFNVLSYVDIGTIYFGMAKLQIYPFLICSLMAFAYFNNDEDKNLLIQNSLFFVCGAFAALFGFMNWHPQWIVMAAPFWVLSTMINKNHNIFLWLDLALGVLFNILVVNVFAGFVDQHLLLRGVLLNVLSCKIDSTITMSTVFKYNNVNMIYTLMSVIFCAYFIFKSKKYCIADLKQETVKIDGIFMARFLLPVCMFLGGALVCLPNMLKQPDNIWLQTEDVYKLFSLGEEANLKQLVTLPCDSLDSIKVYTKKSGEIDNLELVIVDNETKEILKKVIVDGDDVKKKGYTVFDMEHLKVNNGKQYLLYLVKEGEGSVSLGISSESKYHTKFYNVVQQNYDNDILLFNNYEFDDRFINMQINGYK